MLVHKKSYHGAVLLFLWAVIYLWSLPSPALFDDADTVHAQAVREMAETGDWVTLRINNGIRYLEKAPFMYWLSALSVAGFGLSEWSVRLPLALFALFLTLLIYRFGTRFWNDKVGFYSALVYVTSLGPYAFTRILLPDVMLTFFMAMGFHFYLRVVEEENGGSKVLGRWDGRALAIYAAAALAILTKGLVGAVFLGMVILVHMVLTGNWGVLKRLEIVPGIALFVLIAAPWHLAAGFSNDRFFWFYFVNEHFLRYLGLRYPKDYDTVPRWLFWLLHLVWLFPWSAYIWGLVRNFPRSLRPDSQTARINLFLFTWILVILAFFSFSTTQEYYTFPTLPAFSLLLGQTLAWVDSREGSEAHRKAVAGLGVLCLVGILVGGVLFVLAWYGKAAAGSAAQVSDTLTVNPDQYALSFGHVHDLTPATFGHLASLVRRTAVFLGVGPLLALLCALWKRWHLSAICLSLMMVGLLHSYHAGMVAFEPVVSSKSLARVIEYHHKPGDRIFIHQVYERGSSINFYTNIQVSIVNGHFGNLWYGSFYPDAPPIFFNDENFLPLWNSDQRIFLFSEVAPLQEFLARHPELKYRVLAEEGGKKVLVNW
ncbi:MAG: phospholipid carrier-dependent glycosyltransferase [Syntrophobacteraceae bacterium]|nr:phospholipid carrier-dependent glycosyltransferase [Syntrophobacteraceae bacterium]